MFLVVFRNRKHPEIDEGAYLADATEMVAMAGRAPGFVSFKSYTADDGEVVAISEWIDEASARSWGRVAEHRLVQDRGRRNYYVDYTLFACADPRIHRFEAEPS